MLHEFKLQHSAAEATRNIASAFGLKSPSKRSVRYWFGMSSFGDFNLEGKPAPGRRMSQDDQVLRTVVEPRPDTTARLITVGMGAHFAAVPIIWPQSV